MNTPLNAPERREFLGFDGGPLAADVYGQVGSPTVLLLHGSGQTRHAWKNAGRILSEEGWYAVALDLPGHGESAWSKVGDYRTHILAEAMSGIWRELGQPLAVVGASLGGLISMATIARSDAPSVAALVLVDIAPRVAEGGRARIRDFMRAHPNGFATLDEAAEHIAAYRGRSMDGRVEGLTKNLRRDPEGRWIWHWDPRLVSENNRKNRPDADYYERALCDLDVPTLLVRGLLSDVVNDDSVRALKQVLPGVRVVDLPGVDHMVASDANDDFTASVTDFLREVMPPGQVSQIEQERI